MSSFFLIFPAIFFDENINGSIYITKRKKGTGNRVSTIYGNSCRLQKIYNRLHVSIFCKGENEQKEEGEEEGKFVSIFTRGEIPTYKR